MKVLFVLEHYHPYIGGAEKLFQKLAETLVCKGHKAVVVTTRFNPELPHDEIVNGVVIKRVNVKNRFLFTFFSLFSVIREGRNCDFIHTTSYNAALPAFLAGVFTRKKVVITFHEILGRLWFKVPFISVPNRILNYLYEKFILTLRFRYFIAVSEYTKKRLYQYKINKSKIVRIYNGIDYEQFSGYKNIPVNGFTYTYFGRVGVTKGLNTLLAVAQKFNRENPEAILKLIIPKTSTAGYRNFLDLIRKHRIQQQLIILHNLTEKKLHQELLSSNCIVIPSVSEGFCYAAVESVALGVPVVSSGQGALREVVSGLHIDMNGYSTQSLYDALNRAKENQWDEEPVKRFEWDKQFIEYEALYSIIMNGNSQGQK